MPIIYLQMNASIEGVLGQTSWFPAECKIIVLLTSGVVTFVRMWTASVSLNTVVVVVVAGTEANAGTRVSGAFCVLTESC